MKYIPADKLIAEIERRIEEYNIQSLRGAELSDLLSFIITLQQEQPEASIECGVRVYPELDEKPRPWVSLYGKGISMISFRDLPKLESLGFKDYDTAIVTIARKEK